MSSVILTSQMLAIASWLGSFLPKNAGRFYAAPISGNTRRLLTAAAPTRHWHPYHVRLNANRNR